MKKSLEFYLKHKTIFLIIIMLFFINCNKNKKQAKTSNKNLSIENIEKPDTITRAKLTSKIIEPKGNQVFSNSKKLHTLKWESGYILDLIEVSKCDESADAIAKYSLEKKIENIITEEDSFTIRFRTLENCCSNFLCEAELNDQTLNIIYHSFGFQCSCKCLFTLTYRFNFNESFNDINIERTVIKNVIVNGDKNSKTEFK
ncbi:hypothetical protein [Mesonia sp. K7]|uniref:hypothetical protein n=1 Tax=Mesonia sp. K7 TaxID=2218606 RepID=UPI000DA977A8|nr:hypothetical protein [Mesonia sp. K7]PZD78259.1 hypothetical protein DNG35_06050 [Mesonia sp. K7]